MKTVSRLALVVVGLTTFAGCGSKDAGKDTRAKDDESEEDAPTKKKKKPTSSATATASSVATAAAPTPPPTPTPTSTDTAPSVSDNKPPSGPVTDPNQQTYADVANPIADNCASPSVLVTSAPESVGPDYPWTWTRQAMLANQQFKVVSGSPAAHGEVAFEVHQASDTFKNAWVLVAKCHDGSTCNKLAAVSKAIIRGAVSQPVCGPLPMQLSASTFKKPVLHELGAPQNTLPESSDISGQCARLHACTIAMDPIANAKTNIGLDCQKSPSYFKTSCATRYPCVEVTKCLE
jgi:hypothetical protein